MTGAPYSRLASVYDILYDELFDAGGEAERLHQLIQQRIPGARDLLDVACGTGRHLSHLRQHYRVEGVDREPAMLRAARKKLPHVRLRRGDLLDLNLPRRFDVVTCLFSSIAYVRTPAALRRAVGRLALHLRPGGLLVVDGWIAPEDWSPGYVLINQAQRDGTHVVRVSRSGARGRLSTMDWHVLIADRQAIEHFTEHHELGLFTREEYLRAMERAGLTADVMAGAADGRDRYVGRKPERVA